MKKLVPNILYALCSIAWLYLSCIFISPLLLESPGSTAWSEDVVLIPMGFVMIGIWIVSLILFLLGRKRMKK